MENNMKIYAGVDVGKMFLDISLNDTHFRVNNNEKGFGLIENNIKANITEDTAFTLVCEASGGYEESLISYFHSRGYNTHVAHANKVKSFARTKGYLAKTDKIDCKIIEEYAIFAGITNDQFRLSSEELAIKQLIYPSHLEIRFFMWAMPESYQ
jgi:transposase